MKKVAVVVLNYKVKKETLACIESVKKSTYKNLQIIVVDNHSNDGLSGEIKKFEEVTFIENSENLGFTGGNNIGIKFALNLGANFIFILNPDTEVDKDCIDNLVKAAEKIGDILSPKIYFGHSKKIWYAGGTLDLANVLGKHRGMDEIDSGRYDKAEETDYTTGAAMLIKREVFEKNGLFDERFFLYYEDADFCIRAKKVGFKIYYVPSALVYHKNAQSTGLGSPLQDYFITRNRLFFAAKYLSFRTRFALLREALRNLGSPVRRQALFDFLTGNFGKGSFKI